MKIRIPLAFAIILIITVAFSSILAYSIGVYYSSVTYDFSTVDESRKWVDSTNLEAICDLNDVGLFSYSIAYFKNDMYIRVFCNPGFNDTATNDLALNTDIFVFAVCDFNTTCERIGIYKELEDISLI